MISQDKSFFFWQDTRHDVAFWFQFWLRICEMWMKFVRAANQDGGAKPDPTIANNIVFDSIGMYKKMI